MIRVFLIALLLLAALLPQDGWACSSFDYLNAAEIEQAYFVGKIKILDIRPKGEGLFGKIIDLELVEPYTNSTTGRISISGGIDSCGRADPVKGQVWEEVIFERETPHGKIYRPSRMDSLIKDDKWEKLRTQSKNPDAFNEEKKICAEKHGQWTFQKWENINIFDCYLPASDHGKECASSQECQGLCEVILLPHEKDLQEVSKKGQCGSWQNPKGCFYTAGHESVTWLEKMTKKKIVKQECFR